MVTPINVSLCMCSRWIAENGISRGTRINWRRYLSIPSAARSIRLLLAPVAMAESDEGYPIVEEE